MDHSLQILIVACILCCNAVTSAPRQKRLSLASQMPSYYYTNVDGHPGTYSFGYDVLDPITGNAQFRSEERYPNGTVVGSYGYIDARGKSRRVDYVADEYGYRILNEAPRGHKYMEQTNQNYAVSTETSVSWTRPKKTNKKKTEKIKIPSDILNPPY